jgi:hypothetical protein
MTSKRSRLTAAAVIVLTLSALAQLVAGAEPKRVTVAPGMIELRLEAVPADADVSWEARQPLALDYRVYEGGTVFVTARATPGQFVVASDVIDWVGRKRDRTTWIVTVGDKPGPDPDPDPKPDPVKPIPQGLAGEVYKLAKPINEPEKSLKYAINFEMVSSKIGAGGITSVNEARDEIIAINLPLSTGSAEWTRVGTFIAQQISKQPTLADIKVLFDLVAIGLRAAGESK